ncbi:MAG: MerR family transcriptional regulator [Pseudomonadota bacterium]
MHNGYPIAFIERATGISRETLRIWERRYGFPAPARDAQGDRIYSQGDMDRLRRIKRLMDQGHRPGKLVPLGVKALARLEVPARTEMPEVAEGLEDFLTLLRRPGAEGARDWLRRRMAREPLASVTTGLLEPLTRAVGDAWAAGRLCVHEEHLYSEMMSRLLRGAIDALPPGTGPTILLTTLSEERHGLSLLMVEALLRAEDARCINLGVDTPIPEILLAVERHGARVLALSFSRAFPRRRIGPQLTALREQLPAGCQIWAGGGGMAHCKPLPGIQVCHELPDATALLAAMGATEVG